MRFFYLVAMMFCFATASPQITETKLTAGDGERGDLFGVSVSLWGENALVGAPYDDDNGNNSGSAYIFYFNGEEWVEEAKLLPGDGSGNDWFGSAVSLSGDCAVIGAPNVGAAYVFRREGFEWIEEALTWPPKSDPFCIIGSGSTERGRFVWARSATP